MGIFIIILAIAYFAVFFLASLCIGGALFRRLGLGGKTFLSARGKVGMEAALGMGLWGLIYFPLSAVPWLWADFGKAVFIVLMLLAIVKWHRQIEDLIEAYGNWRKRRRQSGGRLSLHSILGILIFIFLLLTFINACGPSRAWDELVDHLPRANFIAENGAFAMDPANPFNGYPSLIELLYSPPTGIASELCAVTVFAFGIALLMMIAGYARTFLPSGWANPAVVIFFSMPLIVDLMRSALVDIPLACFCFGVFYLVSLLLVDARGDRGRQYRLIFVAGIFLGFALSVKYTGILVAVGWLLILPVTLLLLRTGIKHTIGLLLTFIITALVVCGGWYARNLMLYNNPVYPFFEGIFGGGAGTAFDIGAFMRPEMQKSPLGLLLYPVRLVFDYDLIRHWYRAITPAFLCFIPLGLILGGRDKFRLMFNIAIWLGLVHLCLAYFTSPGHTRYLLPLWAVWAPAAAWGLAKASNGSRFLRNIAVPIILIAPMLLVLAMQGKRTIELAPYFIGRIDSADVIAQEMPSHREVVRMNERLTTRDKVLSIEPRIFYMPEGTVVGTPGIEAPDCPRWDEENTSALAAGLQAKGFTHIFIDFASRQVKHAIAMDFFLATIPAGAEGRYYSYDGIVEEMEQRFGIADFFTKEDLYLLSAMGGFDVYKDASGRDWHWVERTTIEERAGHSRNLKFIRHFWLLEDYVLEEVKLIPSTEMVLNREDSMLEPLQEEVVAKSTAVLYRINYSGVKRMRHGQKRYSGKGRLKGLNRTPNLTHDIQYPNEDELVLWIERKSEGMI